MTTLLTIYYNGHFTQMCYPEAIQEQLEKWGLPPEDIDVVEYPGEIKAPFNHNENLEVFLLTKEEPPTGETPTPMDFKSSLEEIKKTPLGKKFLEAIAANNKTLKENQIPLVPIEFEETETVPPAYYSVDEKLVPVSYMRKGKITRDFKSGKEIKEKSHKEKK